MSPTLSGEQLQGVRERLQIADENIRNLDALIDEFVDPLPFTNVKVEDGAPIIGEEQRDSWDRMQKASKEIPVPLPFSIRAGEIIHHLRSCLDHIAWQLADPIKRVKTPRQVQFPIILDWNNKKELSTYERQTEFVTNPAAETIIKKLQPASTKSPKDDHLWIIHEMDIIDKHRELVLCLYVPRIQGPTRVTRDYAPIPDGYGTRMLIPLLGTAKVQADIKISLNVAFAQFGQGKDAPVIKSLVDLTNTMKDVVAHFA